MIKLDDNLLNEIGLAALPKEEKGAFLKHMYETLEMRVGTRLAERMNDQQMSEFERFIASNDEQGAFHWLESNFPNYKEVVAEEFEKLKAEISPMAPQILSASQQQAQHHQVAPASDGQPLTSQQPSQPQFQSQPDPAQFQQPSQPQPAAGPAQPPQYQQPPMPSDQPQQ